MLDAIWQGLAAPHAVDLKKYTKEDEIKQHFPRIIENNTANRKLVSMPMVADVGLLNSLKRDLKQGRLLQISIHVLFSPIPSSQGFLVSLALRSSRSVILGKRPGNCFSDT